MEDKRLHKIVRNDDKIDEHDDFAEIRYFYTSA